MQSESNTGRTLSKRLKDGTFITAPGVYDLVSARVADACGFPAIYMTGYGVSASLLGMPDAGYVTYSDMLQRVQQICERTTTPLIADADTGFGGALNVHRTVRGYEAAGVAAIQIEDQEFPKRCGHTRGRRVIPVEDMVTKIRVAVDSRRSEEFLIVARTDARSSLGLDEALRRGEAYVKAGADVLFIESPESEEEMRRICSSFEVPLLANMVEGGGTPLLAAGQLQEMGYAVAIFPTSGLLAATQALQSVYGWLRQHGTTSTCPMPLYDFTDMNELVGFAEVWAFDQRYGQSQE